MSGLWACEAIANPQGRPDRWWACGQFNNPTEALCGRCGSPRPALGQEDRP